MPIDLRSDTVTRPSPGMREAMANAEVGDDVFGEDPTVHQLQDTVANLLGKEAGLFVPSGVMGNQLALKVHTSPADEVILDVQSHIFNYESGASGFLSGVQLRPLNGERGILSAEQIKSAIRAGYYWETPSKLVCLENTHNKAGGVIYPLDKIREIATVVRDHNMGLHLDGARLWNATAASGIPESVWAEPFDTVNVCLSKGLGAPVGSVLTGSKELIDKAHRYRKMFGGGMRQVGILAAAGLYALKNQRPRLKEDHDKAKRLALGLAEITGFIADPSAVETNIVMFDVETGTAIQALDKMKEVGVLMVPFGPKTIRATTHCDVSIADVASTVVKLKKLFG